VALCALLVGLTACGGSRSRANTLVIYSPHGRDMLRAFAQEFQRTHPGVDVQSIDMGSQEVLDRVRSERANPQADVWFGAPSSLFDDAARDSLLASSSPSWSAALATDAKDPRGRWYGTY